MKNIRLVFGHGINDLNTTQDSNGKQLKSYQTWKEMLRRCYSKNYQIKRPHYINCTVSSEWLKYSVFKDWYDIYHIDTWHIDKDLLFQNNKEYSAKNCRIIPPSLNTFLTNSAANRGKYPQGVSRDTINNKYMARCRIPPEIGGKPREQKTLGRFATIQEAENTYKKFKAIIIKKMAKHHFDNNNINTDLKISLYNYANTLF